ncbi:UTRA domain-containing protein, partial [Nonomuraea sp. RK-328]|nr:UTRA domain-containing protein [Nonomuraea sp. RK-328]
MAINWRDEGTTWAAACRRVGATGHLLFRGMPHEAASEDVAQALRLPGSRVATWQMRGDINGQLVCLDQMYVSAERSREDDFDVERPSGMVDLHIHIHLASPKEALTFRVSRGSALLDITRITYNHAGQPLQLLRRLLDPQRVH